MTVAPVSPLRRRMIEDMTLRKFGPRTQDRYKAMTLATDEFIRRFLIHVLPHGFHRIRHYGLFANSCRADNIAQARRLLSMARPVSTTRDIDSIEAAAPQAPSHPCPCCGGPMIIIEIFARGCSPHHPPSAPVAAIRIDTS